MPKALAILDASAILAYLQREPGYQRVRTALENGAAVSAVNLAEVYARIVARGLDLAAVAARLSALGVSAQPFTEADARLSAALHPQTQAWGLSLGDRACLALGRRLGLPVLTADQAWRRAHVGVEVQFIR